MSPAEPQLSGIGTGPGSSTVPLKPLDSALSHQHCILTLRLRNCLQIAWVWAIQLYFQAQPPPGCCQPSYPPQQRSISSQAPSLTRSNTAAWQLSLVSDPPRSTDNQNMSVLAGMGSKTHKSLKLICLSIRGINKEYLISLTITRLLL